jgi:hypothetical protein
VSPEPGNRLPATDRPIPLMPAPRAQSAHAALPSTPRREIGSGALLAVRIAPHGTGSHRPQVL